MRKKGQSCLQEVVSPAKAINLATKPINIVVQAVYTVATGTTIFSGEPPYFRQSNEQWANCNCQPDK